MKALFAFMKKEMTEQCRTGRMLFLGILFVLFEAEVCVCDLAQALNMTQSAVSHQLRVLRNAKLVRGVKEGKEVRYALDDHHVMMIIECGLSHLRERD